MNHPQVKESNTLEWAAIVISLCAAFAACDSAASSKRSSKVAEDALAVSEKTYRLSEDQFDNEKSRVKRDEDRQKSLDRADQRLDVFLQLEQTENRYRLISPTSLQIKEVTGTAVLPEKVELEILVVQQQEKSIALFRLPRAYDVLYLQDTLPNGTKLPLKSARQSLPFPINVQNVSPFECIDCTNNLRLKLFVEAKRLRPSSSELTPRELVSLARAANDFGDRDVAIKSLERAIEDVQSDTLPLAYRSDVLGEIGKTLLLMGQTKGGYMSLETSRELLKQQDDSYRTNPIYDSLLREAQFASRSNDRPRVEGGLAGLAENVTSMKVSVSRKHELIHDAYLSCVAILSEFAEYDPTLKVPNQFLLRRADGQWSVVSDLLQNTKPGDPLPPQMVWAD